MLRFYIAASMFDCLIGLFTWEVGSLNKLRWETNSRTGWAVQAKQRTVTSVLGQLGGKGAEEQDVQREQDQA